MRHPQPERGTSKWYGLSLTLGGGEMTLLELTRPFATLANGGQYVAADPGAGRSETAWASRWI